MKKVQALFASLFIIGLAGILCFYFFVSNSLELFFPFTLALAIFMLPKILLEFFMVYSNMDKNFFLGSIRFFFFLVTFSCTGGYLFPKVDSYLGIVLFMVICILIFWGTAYYNKHKSKEDIISGKVEIKNEETEDDFDFIKMIVLPETDKEFVVKDKFKVSHLKLEGRPEIGHVDSDFLEKFADRVEAPQQKRFINQYKISHNVEDKKFSDFVKDGHHFALLTDIWELLLLWEQGVHELADNGAFNAFPVKNNDGSICCTVIVTRNDNKWDIDECEDIGELLDGEHFYSEN